MIEITKAATEHLEKAISSDNKSVEDNFIRLFMAAG